MQLVKAFGAEVTGVCRGSKVDLARSIGAEHVIDYTLDDVAVIALTGLIESGMVTPSIVRTYPLRETPAAIGYLQEGHARGKSSSPGGRQVRGSGEC